MASEGILKTIDSEGDRLLLRWTAAADLAPAPARTLDSFSFEDLLDAAGAPADVRAAFADRAALAVQGCGWQSWSAGWELVGAERLPHSPLLIPELALYTDRPFGKRRGREILGHFVSYLRAGDSYLCLASREGAGLPPVAYRFDRDAGTVSVEVYLDGKAILAGAVLAEVDLFLARGFFALKDGLASRYDPEGRFARLDFLRGDAPGPRGKGGMPGGYETWYNRYTKIDRAALLSDLEGLGKTENIVKLRFLDRGKTAVFQVDDGWQRAVGEWETNRERFPGGIEEIARRAEAAGYVPGLWMAPLLVTRSSRTFREKPELLLRDGRGEPVVAGFNHNWDGDFYCLDASRDDVVERLGALVARAVDEWGFRYLKLDFLYAGMLPGVPSGGPFAAWERYGRATAALTEKERDSSGRPVAYLGCGLPFGASWRSFPLSRIGADTKEDWDWPLLRALRHVGRPSAYVSLLDTIGRSYLDGTVFVADPDVCFFRKERCSLSVREKETIALVNFLFAGQLMFADDPSRVDDPGLTRRVEGWFRALSESGPDGRPEEFGPVRIARDVYRVESRSGTWSGLVNLRPRAFVLGRGEEASLRAALDSGAALVDNRIPSGAGAVAFRGRSATLVKKRTT